MPIPHNSGNPSKISVVHNGIIENYMALKEKLTAEGYEFKSETDTEVVAHLLTNTYMGNRMEMKQSAKSLQDSEKH